MSSVNITLPDGKVKSFAGPVTGAEIAQSIGPGLAKAALAIKVDGDAKDLAARIARDAKVAVLTRESPESLEILRHDAAHVLAEAVKELYPETQVTFGPATETGFYYDFARDAPFTPEDLERIEKRMHEIVDRNEAITREEWERDRAAEFFKSIGETYKAEWIYEIPKEEAISLYRQGAFVDLCTGPHLPSTGRLGHAFKLMKVAGAYWRGDARNRQLQRVYGTAWPDEKALKQYLFQLEEAEKRDHRRLGRELDLFHQQEEAAGSVFWHPKGWTLYRTIEDYLRRRLDAAGYLEIKTPQLIDRSLWVASGHWEKFRQNMFTVRDEKALKQYLFQLEEAEKRDHRRLGRELDLFHQQEEAAGSVFWHPKGWTLYRVIEDYLRRRLDAAGYLEIKTPQLIDRSLWVASGHWEKFRQNMFTVRDEDDGKERVLAVKPMSCPGHVQVFRQGLHSYRELPLRLAEFGACHRNEPSGALHGIMRVRAFTQDDAHIFCTEAQITSETVAFCDLLRSVYRDFGFPEVAVKFSDRPPVRAGTDEIWDRMEGALKAATEAAGLAYQLNPGEGAFYGPKLEFVLRDAIGRDWQCGTLQVDFVLPERLDASYIGEDGQRHRPVMLHRAIFGSMERFIAILIEQYAGRLPLWLAPVQAVVATITSDADGYAETVRQALGQAGLRAEADLRNEKINYKVREHSLAKVPALLVVGKREAETRTVAIRRLGGKDQEVLALDEAVARLKSEAAVPSM